jgi:hypothetical protein
VQATTLSFAESSFCSPAKYRVWLEARLPAGSAEIHLQQRVPSRSKRGQLLFDTDFFFRIKEKDQTAGSLPEVGKFLRMLFSSCLHFTAQGVPERKRQETGA